MKTYAVSEQLLQNILRYLYTRPYSEVAQGVSEITNVMREQDAQKEQVATEEKAPKAKK